MKIKQQLAKEEILVLLETLKKRFASNINRHKDFNWSEIQVKLEGHAEKLWSLSEMEISGGEPDVVGYDEATREYLFVDCSPESPVGRRNLCYDRAALESRKTNKPKNSAVDAAESMRIALLTEEQYRLLQQLGEFDKKTSSWIKTPAKIRALGGALFCDRRYNHVFTYHNGADSYYAARGFRGMLKV